ncbi:hypothetical protein [Kistimonas scapharcae]|uniref:hypothetical protein n=1 Tax=Kistimonas scapharcae TaxID=1036133 RepID=UPI0031EB825B
MLQDHSLSLTAKGLLSLLLSLPTHWRVRRSWLREKCTEGRRRIDQALRELQQAGFILCEQENQAGRFRPVIYRVYPVPQGEHRCTASGIAVNESEIAGNASAGAGCNRNGYNTDRCTASGIALHLLENKHYIENKQSFPGENDHISKKPKSEIPFQAIVDQYNRILAPLGCQRCLKLSQKRIAAIRRRWKESPALQSIDAWSNYFTTIATHPNLAWLRGNNGRGWVASIDYLISERGFLKVTEQSQSEVINHVYPSGRVQHDRESTAEKSSRQIREYLAEQGISEDEFAYHLGLETTH